MNLREKQTRYTNLFNKIKNNWNNQMYHPHFRDQALCWYIERNASDIEELGRLHKELKL